MHKSIVQRQEQHPEARRILISNLAQFLSNPQQLPVSVVDVAHLTEIHRLLSDDLAIETRLREITGEADFGHYATKACAYLEQEIDKVNAAIKEHNSTANRGGGEREILRFLPELKDMTVMDLPGMKERHGLTDAFLTKLALVPADICDAFAMFANADGKIGRRYLITYVQHRDGPGLRHFWNLFPTKYNTFDKRIYRLEWVVLDEKSANKNYPFKDSDTPEERMYKLMKRQPHYAFIRP